MYEYRFETLYLHPERIENVDLLYCDYADFQAIIREAAQHGWRYVGTEKFSRAHTACLLIFERKKPTDEKPSKNLTH